MQTLRIDYQDVAGTLMAVIYVEKPLSKPLNELIFWTPLWKANKNLRKRNLKRTKIRVVNMDYEFEPEVPHITLKYKVEKERKQFENLFDYVKGDIIENCSNKHK